MDKKRHKKILIIKPSSLGDIIHSLPTLKAVRQLFPKAFISWLVKEEWAGILEGNPYLDEILSFPFTLKGMPRIIGSVRKRRFDLVLDLQGLLRSSVISLLSGASIRIGYDSAREGAKIFYTERVRVPSLDIHAVDRYLLSVGIEGFTPTQPDFCIRVDQADTGYVREMLAINSSVNSPLIAINQQARWKTKVWHQERFDLLADLLADKLGARIVLVGSDKKENAAEKAKWVSTQRAKSSVGRGRLHPALPVEGDGRSPAIEATRAPLIDMRGKTNLKQLAALLKEVDLLVTNDSGPMHIAAALGTPVVAIFGPTDPKRTGPYGEIHRVIRGSAKCSPCFKKKCGMPSHLCMDAISVDMVLEEVSSILKTNNTGSVGAERTER
ncbi:MAG TPA: glycosyltransferase family 9 protein [Nitrospiria bacterium]|nr:glycosyltransferase family 9 protein [Nitrospiria bacterium]